MRRRREREDLANLASAPRGRAMIAESANATPLGERRRNNDKSAVAAPLIEKGSWQPARRET